MPRKKMTVAQLQNLPQYKDLSVEEIARKYVLPIGDEKEKVKEFLAKMDQTYDLSNLNPNDEQSVHDLALIFARIERVESIQSQILKRIEDGEEKVDVGDLTRTGQYLRDLRDSASKLQQDLNITRKARLGENETSVVETIDKLKNLAKTMLARRLNYIYCPECRELNATAWFLDPASNNSLTITCCRCNNVFTVTSLELIRLKNKNLEDILPT